MEIRHIVFLLIFFILYVIFGGIVFMLLEWPDEQIKRKEIGLLLNEFTEHIKRLNHTQFTEEKFRLIIHELLMAQDNNLIDSYGNQQPFINWSFINSFFFAITVITTIGYGHLTPRTIMGKFFCIIYALFGIPITSLLIGSVADRFSKLYSPKVCLYLSYANCGNLIWLFFNKIFLEITTRIETNRTKISTTIICTFSNVKTWTDIIGTMVFYISCCSSMDFSLSRRMVILGWFLLLFYYIINNWFW